MNEARKVAADCQGPEDTAEYLATWMRLAAENQKHADYYHGLLKQCAEIIGDRAYRNGRILYYRIPELIGADYTRGHLRASLWARLWYTVKWLREL
jgi:hypothetical protein